MFPPISQYYGKFKILCVFVFQINPNHISSLVVLLKITSQTPDVRAAKKKQREQERKEWCPQDVTQKKKREKTKEKEKKKRENERKQDSKEKKERKERERRDEARKKERKTEQKKRKSER